MTLGNQCQVLCLSPAIFVMCTGDKWLVPISLDIANDVLHHSDITALRCLKQLDSWNLRLGDSGPSSFTEAVSTTKLMNQ